MHGMSRDQVEGFLNRRGARRIGDVPAPVLHSLSGGEIETVNLMEWLAADMAALARVVAGESRSKKLKRALVDAAERMAGTSITERLDIAGSAIAQSVDSFDSPAFEALAAHRSDLVRQWACYAVNDNSIRQTLAERVRSTLRFAADRNMTVRETAWMAFRPHLQLKLEDGLSLLERQSRAEDENVRRFAVETTRPRSVWGCHIEALKRAPQLALPLLENVKKDRSRYVQLAVGNWLNDASKTRPDWVTRICSKWSEEEDRNTAAIVRRGLRTLTKTSGRVVEDFALSLMPAAENAVGGE